MIEARGLWDLIERRAEATPDARFAIDESDRELSFAAYREAALRCAAGLHEDGVSAGDVVSWQLPTWLESLVLVGALARLGAVQNPILPIYREREVGFVVRQCGASRLLVPKVWRGFDHAAMAGALADELPHLRVTLCDPTLPDGDPAALPPAPAPTRPEDAPDRWLFYSSGTTADPKGARHTDHTLMAFSRGMAAALALAPDDRIALVFPFTHIGGIGWLFAGLLCGSSHIVVPVFDPVQSIDTLARHRVTQATAGTVFHQAYLAAQRERGPEPLFPGVRCFPGGGAPKPPQLHFDVKAELGGAGIVSGYGMTECPILAMNSVRDSDAKLAHTEGPACPPEVDIRVVRHDGTLAPPEVEGEFRVKAPQLCRGYVDAALDAEAFDADGYFRTGDLGYLDPDGYVVVTGRLKDVIIRNGENVSAKEIEDLLHGHPKVQELAVIGLPDPKTGERVCAVVVCRDPADPLSFEEMSQHLLAHDLMRQKLPEQLELASELPRNATGKVLKRDLIARFGG
ncbi:MAG: AMP-binding protein [Proteobacteria bacterium]|nr:AMP-binding protein [Pseudomonadota bacterium]